MCSGPATVLHRRPLRRLIRRFLHSSSDPRATHARLLKSSARDISLFNNLITHYFKSNLSSYALSLFTRIPSPNVVTWTALITAHSNSLHSLRHFLSMLRHSILPNHRTLASLEHYTCLVGGVARVGQLERAERIVSTMPFEPDAAVWRALLSACAYHGAVDKARIMARRVLELEPHDDSAFVIVANVLSAAGRWDDVAELRKTMKDRRVKKKGGRSWIEVQGKVHVFVAGDWKHERSVEIYQKLEELMGDIEKLGYVPVWDELLHNVGEEKSKDALWYHSEKLAVAFGVLCGSIPPGKALRIVKNLRICKDCHEAFKYMTRVLEREIIVRDVNRYHRFVNGDCTCRDI